MSSVALLGLLSLPVLAQPGEETVSFTRTSADVCYSALAHKHHNVTEIDSSVPIDAIIWIHVRILTQPTLLY